MHNFKASPHHHLGGHPRSLECDAEGRLYDPRVREALSSMPGDEKDRELFETFAALRTTTHSFRVLMDRWAEKHGLTDGRLRLLFLLRFGSDTLGGLADKLEVSPRNVTGLVDLLERDGLVERVPDEHDRRAVRARLTELGQEKVRAVSDDMLEARRRTAANFSSEELAQLRHLCLKLLKNVGQISEEATA